MVLWDSSPPGRWWRVGMVLLRPEASSLSGIGVGGGWGWGGRSVSKRSVWPSCVVHSGGWFFIILGQPISISISTQNSAPPSQSGPLAFVRFFLISTMFLSSCPCEVQLYKNLEEMIQSVRPIIWSTKNRKIWSFWWLWWGQVSCIASKKTKEE